MSYGKRLLEELLNVGLRGNLSDEANLIVGTELFQELQKEGELRHINIIIINFWLFGNMPIYSSNEMQPMAYAVCKRLDGGEL